MKREFDPRRLDVKAFAKAGGELDGAWPIDGFARLQELLVLPADGARRDLVRWSAGGLEVPVSGGPTQIRLRLRAQTALPLVCQHCLKPYEQALSLDREFLFAPTEAEAAALDDEIEVDVLPMAREFDLHELLEDELLLDLPLVPRHDVCPEPLPMSAGESFEDAQPRAFAALAALRRGGG